MTSVNGIKATDIAEETKRIIADTYELPKNCIEETDKFSDLGDSLEAIEAQGRIEDEFHITFPEADVKKFITVGDLIAYLKENL